jgi:hypothetical protein
MAQTVIGIFDTRKQAENAAEELIVRSFNSENIHISTPDAHKGRGDVTDVRNTLSLGNQTANYFRTIFSNEDDVLKYTAVAEQGVIVAVQTEQYDQAQAVAAILDSFGAVDVGERSRILEDSLTREDRTKGYATADRSTPEGVGN